MWTKHADEIFFLQFTFVRIVWQPETLTMSGKLDVDEMCKLTRIVCIQTHVRWSNGTELKWSRDLRRMRIETKMNLGKAHTGRVFIFF